MSGPEKVNCSDSDICHDKCPDTGICPVCVRNPYTWRGILFAGIVILLLATLALSGCATQRDFNYEIELRNIQMISFKGMIDNLSESVNTLEGRVRRLEKKKADSSKRPFLLSSPGDSK